MGDNGLLSPVFRYITESKKIEEPPIRFAIIQKIVVRDYPGNHKMMTLIEVSSVLNEAADSDM